jgi:hypothetical protein
MAPLRRLALLAGMAAALATAAGAQAQTPDLQGLHDALHLTAAQEPAWKTFVAASFADSDEAARRDAAVRQMPALSAPRRVDLSIAMMQAELETLQRRGAALKAFYATLTASQQAAFDRATAPGER